MITVAVAPEEPPWTPPPRPPSASSPARSPTSGVGSGPEQVAVLPGMALDEGAPSSVVARGGDADPLFPVAHVRETADALPKRRTGGEGQRAGRRSNQGRARSSWEASRSSSPSPPGAATNWTPSGSPSGVQCSGTLIAGRPVRFASWV